MIRCRSCGNVLAVLVQGKAVIGCTKCREMNMIVSQGSVNVETVRTQIVNTNANGVASS